MLRSYGSSAARIPFRVLTHAPTHMNLGRASGIALAQEEPTEEVVWAHPWCHLNTQSFLEPTCLVPQTHCPPDLLDACLICSYFTTTHLLHKSLVSRLNSLSNILLAA